MDNVLHVQVYVVTRPKASGITVPAWPLHIKRFKKFKEFKILKKKHRPEYLRLSCYYSNISQMIALNDLFNCMFIHDKLQMPISVG